MSFEIRFGPGSKNGISMWDAIAHVPVRTRPKGSGRRSNPDGRSFSGYTLSYPPSTHGSSYSTTYSRYKDDIGSVHSGKSYSSYGHFEPSGQTSGRSHSRRSHTLDSGFYQPKRPVSHIDMFAASQPSGSWETPRPVFVPTAPPASSFLFVPAPTATPIPVSRPESSSAQTMPSAGPFGFSNSQQGRERFERDRMNFGESRRNNVGRGTKDEEDEEAYYEWLEEQKARRDQRDDMASEVSSIAYSHGNVQPRDERGGR